MKKLLALLLSATMLFALTACGGSEEDADTNPVIKVATSPDYAPYEYYDEDGNITGFDYDALAVIEAYLAEEIPGVSFEWHAMNFDTIVSAVQTGQMDLGVSCFTYDPERDVLFSDPYLTSAQVLVVVDDYTITTKEELEGKKIGAGTGTTGEAAAIEQIPTAEVSSSGDYTVTFEILKNGGYDAVACDEAVALNYVKAGGFKILEEKLVSEEVSIITSNDDTELMSFLNSAIAKFVESEDYDLLKEKYALN